MDLLQRKNRPELSPGAEAAIHRLLCATGGPIFPVRKFTDNVEVLLFSAIVAIALRTFFLQPFSIPTNSMWPTHRGMVAHVLSGAEPAHPIRNFFLGKSLLRISSPADGVVYIPINDGRTARQQGSLLPFSAVRMWKFGLWPVTGRRYEIFVNAQPVAIDVPAEFDLENPLVRRFFPEIPSERLLDVLQSQVPERRADRYFLKTREIARTGQEIFRFEVVHGDVLFVDRLTPHFFPPRRGEAIVFATRSVPSLAADDRYYIKRAVAIADDRVSICNGELWVSGAVANFSEPMAHNNNHLGHYHGYCPYGLLENSVVQVPPEQLFVLGDNSSNSYDSRFFGPIPATAVVGRPFFRVYPLRERPEP
jgi:signal peptidase I